LFYVLAGIFRRRSANVYFASATACAALWQFVGYYGQIDHAYYTMLYAVLGIAVLAAGRALGIDKVATYDANGTKGESLRGRGLALFQSGNSILFVALLAAFWQGLAYLARERAEWQTLSALMLTTVASYTAIALVPLGQLAPVILDELVRLDRSVFLDAALLIHLSGWQNWKSLRHHRHGHDRGGIYRPVPRGPGEFQRERFALAQPVVGQPARHRPADGSHCVTAVQPRHDPLAGKSWQS